MLAYMLEKQFKHWKTNPANTNKQDFLHKVVAEQRADHEDIQQVLERQPWFQAA
jgi:hypothetical protein